MFLAYVLACVAHPCVHDRYASRCIGTISRRRPAAGGDLAIVAVGTPIIGAVAALPTALVVAIAEGFAWRSVILYAALGGALALALSYGLDMPGIAQPDTYIANERQLLAASGIAGGLVYWLFAGRSAGSWK
jgi:hypothetical protein